MLIMGPIFVIATVAMLINLARTDRPFFHEVPERIKVFYCIGVCGMIVMSLFWTIEALVSLGR